MQFVQERAQKSANIVLGCEVVTLIDVILIEIQNGSFRGPEERGRDDRYIHSNRTAVLLFPIRSHLLVKPKTGFYVSVDFGRVKHRSRFLFINGDTFR